MRAPRRAFSFAAGKGFTILEAMVATAIFMVVMYGVYVIYDVGERNYVSGSRKWDVQSQARVAIERMARELRMAGYASPKLTDPIVIATNDTVAFHADVDGSGAKYITYSRRDCSGNLGTTLFRNVYNAGTNPRYCGGDPFIENINGLTFTYYELNNVPIPYPLTSTYQLDSQAHTVGTGTFTTPATGGQRDSVRQVKISLTVSETAGGKTFPFTISTDVALRNLLP
jgi:type II secretory pathway pseudopilin PulG